MDSAIEKHSTPARTLVFGLLDGCLNTENAENCFDCPLKDLHEGLSMDKKHQYVMDLSDREVESVLATHGSCYEKRLADLDQW